MKYLESRDSNAQIGLRADFYLPGKKRMHYLRLLVLFLFSISFCAASFSNENDWRFGKAKAKITPKQFMWMSGYGSRNKPADGKLTDLWAKVLVLEDTEKNRAVLITLDLIGVGRSMSTALCKRLQEEFEFKREQIAICTSHTHTGPALSDNLMPLHYLVVDRDQQKLIEAYTSQLKESIIEAVGKAIESMAPAKLKSGTGKSTFAVNRRNNPEAKVPELRTAGKLVGPTDHDVPVLAVHGADDSLQAVVFGYACHATVLSFYKWSGDYPGFAQLSLEKKYPNCQAMFWAGCGADQNPLPRRKVELAKEYGKRLSESVERVLQSKMRPLGSALKMSFNEVPLPLAKLPTRKKIEADSKSKNRFVQARAKFLLSLLEKNGALEKTYPYPVQTWRIGNQIDWIFLGGEVVVDFSIRIKSENQSTSTWVAGYANDVMAYIASRRVLREGGYEGATAMVYYGLPAPWALESENIIIDEVNRQLKSNSKE